MNPQSNPEKSRVPFVLAGLGAVAAILILLGVSYIASRLETLDDRIAFQPPTASADIAPLAPGGQRHAIYVPAYSHIYSRGGQAYMLEVTLSFRNTDPERQIRVERVDYFDTKGAEIRRFDAVGITLGPLETVSYLIEKRDAEGGSGANFIVEWSADGEVNPPIAEAVMIGVDTGHQLSFTSRGEAISRRGNGDPETTIKGTTTGRANLIEEVDRINRIEQD